jgi:beta-xylosidase
VCRLTDSPPDSVATHAAKGRFRQEYPLFVTGGRYYAYSTQIWSGDRWTNVPVMSSTNLATWSTIKDALPILPGWAKPGNTWAPGVLRRSGRYLLYYTTTQAASGRQCISVATASTPAGPFRDRSKGPLVCQLSQGGSIDPLTPAGSVCSSQQ